MNIVICGAGTVGSHAAEVLGASGHSITVVDSRPDRLETIGDTMDVGTFCGNCASAQVLREAGASDADLLLATTNSDEINLLAASVGKGIGAKKSIARVHHRAYFEQRGLDYQKHFSIDQLICPEFSTAQAIARSLRNPGALAVENFAEGQIEMQEFPVTSNAKAVGKSLSEVNLPTGARLAAITRKHNTFMPKATTVVEPGDVVVLVGNSQIFQESRRLFRESEVGRQKVVIMGGPSMAVWLCRALTDRNFSIRLFEIDRQRAEELAEKLESVTVIQADPTEVSVFEEEHIAEADVFVALVDDDEHNILGCAWAKSRGVKKVIAVAQRPNYLRLLEHVGIDRAFSPRMVAVKEIENVMDESPLRRIASLAEGIIDVYRLRISDRIKAVGQALRDIRLPEDWMIVAVQRKQVVKVPSADDCLNVGDTALVLGRRGTEKSIRKFFGVK